MSRASCYPGDTAAQIIFWERIQFDYTLTCTMNGRVYYIVRSHDISRRDNRRDEVGSQLASPYSPRAIFYLLLPCASFRFLSFKCSTERVQESLSRQDAKSAKGRALSFRPKGEIFLRSLAFARDNRRGKRSNVVGSISSL